MRSTASSGLVRALGTMSVSAMSVFTRNVRGRSAHKTHAHLTQPKHPDRGTF
jgi:hypothetical protein